MPQVKPRSFSNPRPAAPKLRSRCHCFVRYFSLLRDRAGEDFDPDKAARLELDWWQLRRESATPAQYGAVVAQVTQELFHAHNPSIENPLSSAPK